MSEIKSIDMSEIKLPEPKNSRDKQREVKGQFDTVIPVNVIGECVLWVALPAFFGIPKPGFLNI
jgi:hypothetical protein